MRQMSYKIILLEYVNYECSECTFVAPLLVHFTQLKLKSMTKISYLHSLEVIVWQGVRHTKENNYNGHIKPTCACTRDQANTTQTEKSLSRMKDNYLNLDISTTYFSPPCLPRTRLGFSPTKQNQVLFLIGWTRTVSHIWRRRLANCHFDFWTILFA